MKDNLPPWMNDKQERKKRNGRSRKQERERAREVDGITQAGSGSSWRRPEDIVTPHSIEQIKYTDGRGFRITATELQRIFDNALKAGRDPVLVIEFSQHRIRIVGQVERM